MIFWSGRSNVNIFCLAFHLLESSNQEYFVFLYSRIYLWNCPKNKYPGEADTPLFSGVLNWADRDAGSGPPVELLTLDGNLWVAVASEICSQDLIPLEHMCFSRLCGDLAESQG